MIKSRSNALLMAQIDQNPPDPSMAFDPSVQSEKIAFDVNQLLCCPSCARRNPPNRLGCLYCGAMLEVDQLEAAAVTRGFRSPEAWEPGISLVSVPFQMDKTADLSAASRILSLELSVLNSILQASVPLPLCRLATETEAFSTKKLLSDIGIESKVIDDKLLAADKPPMRLAEIVFSPIELRMTAFNSRDQLTIPSDEIVLLVEGVISISKVDQMEKRKGGKGQLQGEVSTISDEPILDIYSSTDNIGFRVLTSGFDFSCLGNEKRLIAAENLKSLSGRLSSVCTNSRTVAEFPRLREPIGRVWEVELRRDTKGLQVTGFGKREIGRVLSTNNLDQFTRFSRLQRLLV